MTSLFPKNRAALAGLFLSITVSQSAVVSAAVETQAGTRRAFTVKDAIERSTINGFSESVLMESPDKRLLAFTTSRGDLQSGAVISTVWLLSRDGQGKVVTVAAFRRSSLTNAPPIASLRWIDHGRALAFLSPDKKGFVQLFRYELRSKKTEQITQLELNVNSFDILGDTCMFVAISPGSAPFPAPGGYLKDESLQRLVFPEQNVFGERSKVFMQRGRRKAVALTTPPATWMRGRAHFNISPRGDKAIAILPAMNIDASFVQAWRGIAGAPKLLPDLPNIAVQPYLVDLDAGTVQPLLSAPTGGAARYLGGTKAVWSADGANVLLSNVLLGPKDLPSGHVILGTPQNVEIQLGANRAVRILPPDEHLQPGERIAELSWRSPNEVTVVSAAGAGGGEGYDNLLRQGHRWQTTYHREGQNWVKWNREEIALAPRQRLGDMEFYVEENANTAPRLVGQEVGTSKRTFEFDPNPQLAKLNLLPIKAVSWQDAQGHTWSGGVILPPPGTSDNGRLPLVIELKFFDPTHFSPDGPYTTAFASQALAAKGIAVLELNAFDAPTMETEQEGPMQMRAVESAIDFLVSQHNINADRVGLIGFSRTCYHVSYTLTHSARHFAAATLADGLSGGYMQYHAFSLNHSAGNGVKPLYDGLNGGPPWGESLAKWIKNSPDMNASKIRAPIRIEMLGGVSVLQEWELYSTLRLQNKQVDALYLPDATHVLVKPRERYLSQQGNVNWFSFWLLGSSGKDKESEADYERWNALKSKASL